MLSKKRGRDEKMQESGGLTELINAIPVAVQGALMAVLISVLRVYYDAEETSAIRACLEASICGALTLAASSAIDWIGAPEQVAVAFGGFIGFIGVAKLRAIIFAWFNRRSGGDTDPT